MQIDEVRASRREGLRLIVLIKARAAPRLRNFAKLWRRTRPGSMTDFIRQEGLLDPIEIDAIIADAPANLIEFQQVAAQMPLAERPSMASWLDRFNLAGKCQGKPACQQ